MKTSTEILARQLDADMERSFRMAKALVAPLDAIMDAHARAIPTYHRHACPCGDWYLCHQNRDECDPNWTCPSCLEREMDEFHQQETEARRADHR